VEVVSKMQALTIEQFGDPKDLVVGEAPRPVPENGDVLVEIGAAAVNRSDVINVKGAFPLTRLPRILGRDFAGTVVEGPDDLVGTEVWGTGGGDLGFTRDGSHAKYMLVPREAVVPKPGNLSVEEAGASGLAYFTAGAALLDLGGLGGGETVLVTGATGGVGSAAAMIARWQSARVIGAIKDESERATAEQLGLHAVIDTSKEDVAESTMLATDGKGAHLALDTVGGPLFEPVLNALAFGGRMVVISTPMPERRVSFDLFDFYRRQLKLFGLLTAAVDSVGSAAVLKKLAPGFEEGTLHAPPIAERYPLSEAVTAYSRVGSGEARGRVLLIPA